ncbi:hypothetical protein DFQ27_009964 [Actinomortierella ambigua]|uniref:CNH domain-containing protein n=1 Tax=Actinomortierella ambigua TaxID=1343610 RepID=A0A9P6U9A6_9FUNG|nr:hypothetical protein DFQ27_009964 [Actinomortierella ambigua]
MSDQESSLDQDDPFPNTPTDLPDISILSLEDGQDDRLEEAEKALPPTPQPTTARLSMQAPSFSGSGTMPCLVEPRMVAGSSASVSSANSGSSGSRAPSPCPLLPPSSSFPVGAGLIGPQPHQGYAARPTAPPDVVVAPPSPLLPLPVTFDPQQQPHHSALHSAAPPLSSSSAPVPPLSFANTGYDPVPPPPPPVLPTSRLSMAENQDYERPPSYIAQAGNRGSMIIAQTPVEDQMFEVSVLSQPLAPDNAGSVSSSNNSLNTIAHSATGTGNSPSSSPSSSSSSSSSLSSSSLSVPHPFISASPMHDQQYLLLGCMNGLHSIDLTLPAHQRKVRTHIQGVAFKEIQCLEDIGLVVVIAGRNSRVRCYDYESIKKLVEYGHSKQGRGRVVEGGRLGPVKHKIQLRVETALLSSSAREGGAVPPGGPNSSPLGKTSRFLQRASYYAGSSSASGTQHHHLPSAMSPPPPPSQQQSSSSATTTDPAVGSGSSVAGRMPGHRYTTSLDRNLLSPLDAESPPLSATDGAAPPKHKKVRPLSFSALASLAQGKTSRDHSPSTFGSGDGSITGGATTATTLPSSSGASTGVGATATATATGTGTGLGATGLDQGNSNHKGKRFAQVASYLTHAAASSHLVPPVQDRPSDEAMDWAWDFVKLRQTKDVMSLDFHYTPTTVFMTVLSKSGIDILRRPKSARGIARPAFRVSSSSRNGSREGSEGGGSLTCGAGITAAGATTTTAAGGGGSSGGGMATASGTGGGGSSSHSSFDFHRSKQEKSPQDWESFKQFYHPEPPSFMTVVKNSYAVTDIILGKAHQACVINVEDMTVKDLHRHEPAPSMLHGLSKKLGFRFTSSGISMTSSSSSPIQLWHSFEKIPYDVPANVLYPDTVDALYGTSSNSHYEQRQQGRRSSIGGTVADYRHPLLQATYSQQPAFPMPQHANTMGSSSCIPPRQPYHEQDNTSFSSDSSSSTPPSNSPCWQPQQPQQQQQHHYPWAQGPPMHPSPLPPLTSATNATSAPPVAGASTRKARMVTSDQVLNMAFSRPTSKQLFLATRGAQSRIVDLTGKPVSGITIDWGMHVPQKIEFLRAAHEIYVVGFERSRIMIFSLTRAVKVKEITRSGSTWRFESQQQQQQYQQQQQLQQQQVSIMLQGHPEGHAPSEPSRHSLQQLPGSTSFSTPSSPAHHPLSNSQHGHHQNHPLLPSAMVTGTPPNYGSTQQAQQPQQSHHHHHGSSVFKFLARDIDDDSFFFSHGLAKQGATVCKLGLAQFEQDDFDLHGW